MNGMVLASNVASLWISSTSTQDSYKKFPMFPEGVGNFWAIIQLPLDQSIYIPLSNSILIKWVTIKSGTVFLDIIMQLQSYNFC